MGAEPFTSAPAHEAAPTPSHDEQQWLSANAPLRPDRWRRVPQFVDPAVSRVKFDGEIALFRDHEEEYRRRGWFLDFAEFPRVLVLFAAPHIRPSPLLFGALFDFSSYDLVPPSLRLVDPFTRKPYTMAELPVPPLLRRVPVSVNAHAGANPSDEGAQASGKGNAAQYPPVQGPALPPGMQVIEAQVVPLLQAWSPDETPFLCVRGVREYHANVAHTGDPWLLHRGRGEGTLVGLCEMVDAYGVRPLAGYQLQFRVQSVRVPGALQQLVQYKVAGFEVDLDRVPA